MQNGYRDFSTGVRIYGPTVSNSAYPSALMANFWFTSTSRNMTAGTGITTDLAGIPDGYRDEASWVMPKSPGALGARNQIFGAGEAVVSMAAGVNGDATLAGTGALSGIGQLIISMVAALAGAGTISSAEAKAFLQLAAALAGQGAIAGALSALGRAVAAVQGTGDLVALSTALGTLAASISVTGDALTTANVADTILDATDGVETGLTLRQALRVIAAATAGTVSGAETTTITFQNALVGDTDRIIATVDSNGNRTAITLDTD